MSTCGCNNSNNVRRWSLLVKPTHNCNFNCKYCYDEPHRKRLSDAIMKPEIHKHIVDLAAKHADEIRWIYHGGEPLTVPMEWYKEVNEHFYEHFTKRFILEMQSNGYNLTEEWVKFLKVYNISLGISFDFGSQGIRNEKSYDRILNNIKRAKELNYEIGSITVINNTNYKHLIEYYEKSKSVFNGGIAFNSIYISKGVLDNNLYFDIHDFIKEFKKYLTHWIRDNKSGIYERTAVESINIVIGSRNLCCTYSDCRYSWIGVGPTGEVYPCDRYVPEKYYMGNIMDFKSIDDLYKTEGHRLYSSETEQRFLTHCAKCGYLKYCGGLCNANHIGASGTASGIDEFSCELFRQKFKATYMLLRDLDIYSGNFNPVFVKTVIEKPFFTLKEIVKVLHNNNIDISQMSCIPRTQDLLNSKEFKVFSIFNQYEGDIDGHSNYNNYKLDVNVSLSPNFRFEAIKEERERCLQKIFDDKKDEIRRVLNE